MSSPAPPDLLNRVIIPPKQEEVSQASVGPSLQIWEEIHFPPQVLMCLSPSTLVPPSQALGKCPAWDQSLCQDS